METRSTRKRKAATPHEDEPVPKKPASAHSTFSVPPVPPGGGVYPLTRAEMAGTIKVETTFPDADCAKVIKLAHAEFTRNNLSLCAATTALNDAIETEIGKECTTYVVSAECITAGEAIVRRGLSTYSFTEFADFYHVSPDKKTARSVLVMAMAPNENTAPHVIIRQ